MVSAADTLESTSRYHASEVSRQECAALVKLILWDELPRLAIPFDLLRMLAVHPQGATALVPPLPAVLSRVLTVVVSPGATHVLLTVIVRLLCNCFRYDALRSAIKASDALQSTLADVITANSIAALLTESKTLPATFASLLSNIAAAFPESTLSPAAEGLLAAARTRLEALLTSSEAYSEDAVHIALQGYGTLVYYGLARGAVAAADKAAMRGVVEGVKSKRGGVLSGELEPLWREVHSLLL